MLCTTVVHSDTHTREQFLKMYVGLGLDLVIVRLSLSVGGAGSSSNTLSPGPRPISVPRCMACVCVSLCTTAVHNTAQNSSDNFRSYPPDNHPSSDDVYWRAAGDSHTLTRSAKAVTNGDVLGIKTPPKLNKAIVDIRLWPQFCHW